MIPFHHFTAGSPSEPDLTLALKSALSKAIIRCFVDGRCDQVDLSEFVGALLEIGPDGETVDAWTERLTTVRRVELAGHCVEFRENIAAVVEKKSV